MLFEKNIGIGGCLAGVRVRVTYFVSCPAVSPVLLDSIFFINIRQWHFQSVCRHCIAAAVDCRYAQFLL